MDLRCEWSRAAIGQRATSATTGHAPPLGGGERLGSRGLELAEGGRLSCCWGFLGSLESWTGLVWLSVRGEEKTLGMRRV